MSSLRTTLALSLVAALAACGGDSPSGPKTEPDVALLVRAPAAALQVSDTFTVSVTRANGTQYADRALLRFRSSDSNVVAIDSASGRATVIAEGAAEITATAPHAIGRATVQGSLVRLGTVPLRSMSYGYYHGCGVGTDGEAYCYGSGGFLALGTGAFQPDAAAPVAALGGQKFVRVDADNGGSCGLTLDGHVYCWGGMSLGQRIPVPTRIVLGGDSTLKATAVQVHTDGGGCTLDVGGNAWCWGSDVYKQLGNIAGPGGRLTTPTRVQTSLRFAELKAGFEHSCGITLDGAIYCWGVTLGYDGSAAVPAGVPQRIELAGRMHGLTLGFSSTCALDATDVAWCWGSNREGELGRGQAMGTDARFGPAPIAGALRFSVLQSRVFSTCGLTSTGELWCWGQIGRGVVTARNTARASAVPVLVSHTRRFVAFGVQPNGVCGIMADGATFCTVTQTNVNAALIDAAPPLTSAVATTRVGAPHESAIVR